MRSSWGVLAAVASLVIAVGLAACGGGGSATRYGVAPPPNAVHVTLAGLVAKPELYQGKDVVVEGEYAGACGDGDFYFKDRFDLIEADPPSPEVTKLASGTRLRLYGLVKVRRSEAAERNESTAGKQERGEATVRIVGKGVEVLK